MSNSTKWYQIHTMSLIIKKIFFRGLITVAENLFEKGLCDAEAFSAIAEETENFSAICLHWIFLYEIDEMLKFNEYLTYDLYFYVKIIHNFLNLHRFFEDFIKFLKNHRRRGFEITSAMPKFSRKNWKRPKIFCHSLILILGYWSSQFTLELILTLSVLKTDSTSSLLCYNVSGKLPAKEFFGM